MGLINTLDNIFNGLAKVFGGLDDEVPMKTSRKPQPERYYEPERTFDFSDTRYVGEKLKEVLKENFSQYDVCENVSPLTLGGTGKFMNYSFGIYSNGKPKLFIMIVGRNTCRYRLYRWSKEVAEKNSIPMINFLEHFPNEIKYIRERLSKYL
ncbi:MAG: hypothetical protein II956_02650 [Bacteroidales bacterium]|nr:hypothetical protein [Bacteroidales bacterium]